MRIALATIALHQMPGGLERNIIYLANFLVEQGVQIVLLTFDLPGAQAFYPIDERIKWHRLGRTPAHSAISFGDRVDLIQRIRDVFTADPPYNYLICFHHGILLRYLAGTIGLSVRIICSERNSLTIYHYVRAKKWNLNFLMLFLTDGITVQFPSYIQNYPKALHSKIKVVHNPVFPPQTITESYVRQPLIVSVGRYAPQKRFDLLIRACAILFRQCLDWRLHIIGDGFLRSELAALIQSLEMGDRIFLIPPKSDLRTDFSQARIYCQPSQWEGFPNAQAEAMAAGLIPVGFQSTSGVSDLIEHGVNGFLCDESPSPTALAGTLLKVVNTPDNWEMWSQSARQITHRYSVESWQQAWKTVLGLSSIPGKPSISTNIVSDLG
ncbi:MAG: glycosyltransferase [Cyanobacteria bacterium P01_A01_bin.37]